MSFLSNLKLAREDDEILVDGAAEPAEIDVTEAIQAEEDALEVQETEAAIEEEQGEIEVQSEVVEELQEQDAAIEEKLETPAEVTPEDVAVAQEAFAFTLGRLAGNSEVYKSYKSMKVSYEDAKTDPVSALKLHQEGVKEMASKVWDSIKVMFQKVVAFFKKIWIKLPAMFTNYVKKAEALKGQINGLEDGFDGKEKALEASKKYLKPFACIEGSSLSKVYEIFSPLAIKLPSEAEKLVKQVEADSQTGGIKAVESFVSGLKLKPVANVKIENKEGEVAVLGLTNDGIQCVSSKGDSFTATIENFDGNYGKLSSTKQDLLVMCENLLKLAKDKDSVLKENDKLFKTQEQAVNKIVKEGIANKAEKEEVNKAKVLRNIIIKLPNICLKTYMVLLRNNAGYISEVIKK